jgi:hypothetical protein
MLAQAASEDFELRQLDVKTAYLYGDIDRELYIQQPPGFQDGTHQACLLLKNLYGLKQGPRMWHKKLVETLQQIGLVESDADPGLFIKRSSSGQILLLVYVDDMLLAGRCEEIDVLVRTLSREFDVRDLGDAAYFLGYEIVRNRAERTLFVCQKKLTVDMVERYLGQVGAVRSRSTPLPEGAKLDIPSLPVDASTKTKYVQVLGSLLYLAAGTRPDISYAARALARFRGSPTKWHWACVQHVLHYLAATAGKGILYGQDSGIQTIADACFAPEGKSSVSGWVVIMNVGAMSWDSRKQDLIAQSSCEAEHIDLSEITREALWLWRLRPLIGLPNCPVDVWCDKTGTLALADHDTSHLSPSRLFYAFIVLPERM